VFRSFKEFDLFVADASGAPSFGRPGESEANARLIAAAPDLLEACRLAVRSWFSGEVSEVQMEIVLRAAIAKAEGK
jgi:hypothetical protein